MKFRKAIIEQSKEFYPEPDLMYEPMDHGSNAAETTISYRPSNPDNEELVVAIERHCMLGNFEAAMDMLKKHYEKLTLADINRLIQFARFIHGDNVRNIALKKEKPEFEKFGPRFIKLVKKKLEPR